MFSPADLEVLQDLSARSQSGFWRAVGWLKRVWTPRRRFLGAWVNSSCGWWWREAVQRAFFFFLPATAFSLWKDGSGEWSQWPWRACTHWHAPGRKHNTHPLIENQRDSYTCTHTLTWERRRNTHSHTTPRWETTQTPGRHWSADLFAYLSLSALILHTATKPPLTLAKQKHKKEAKRGQQAAYILLPPIPPFHPSSVSLYQMFTFPPWKERDVDRQGEKRKKSGRGEGSQGL